MIAVATDHIARRPQIEREIEKIVKTVGTTIRINLDSACSYGLDADDSRLKKLLLDYSIFNPHATFSLNASDNARFEHTAPGWQKWLPSDPTSAHWYNAERLENLIASYIASERHGGRRYTVREFVSELPGPVWDGQAETGHFRGRAGERVPTRFGSWRADRPRRGRATPGSHAVVLRPGQA